MKPIETMQSYHLLERLFSNSDVSYVVEEWNQQYEAVEIKTPNGHFKSRLAQKTPNKKGYFFAMWKKDENHTNAPFTKEDIEDKLIVNIVDNNHRGQFIFPQDILIKKGILKSDAFKGKMALRVYPPWETELNKTATKTQAWQCAYFNEITYE
ncbi:MepB family protein [Staphylococcus sp. GDY8P47P]|nr:MepB family protein [Staphylococcus sp. GDY8P47P]